MEKLHLCVQELMDRLETDQEPVAIWIKSAEPLEIQEYIGSGTEREYKMKLFNRKRIRIAVEFANGEEIDAMLYFQPPKPEKEFPARKIEFFDKDLP